mmetsp:Transcript_9001/g.13266  ORF Transcript_9001/g.13266 Transcript_9001/m.13266 type:complete len:697 (-) Transcript_9001:51-2141(-)
MFHRFLSIAVIILAIFTASVWEVARIEPKLRTADGIIDIYSSLYDVSTGNIAAPVAVSWRLQILVRLMISSPLGGYLIRGLVEKNRVNELVELASAIQDDEGDYSGKEYGLDFPIVRLTKEDYDWHVDAAAIQTATTATMTGLVSDAEASSSSKSPYRSVRDYHAAYANKSTTPSAVLQKLLDFIKEKNPVLGCVQEVDYRGSFLAAYASTNRWRQGKPISIWDGVPVMLKPEENIKGLRTTQGEKFKTDGSDIATHDGVLADRFRKAGAVIVATTVMHERGVHPSGYNPFYNGPSNPYDLKRFSGGSSSGSAVAVATGMVPVAIGYDGGGSIRIPAAWSGTVGLAVGFSRFPFQNKNVNINPSVKSGPLAANVEDAAEAFLLLGQPFSRQGDGGGAVHPYTALYGGVGPPPPHLHPRWLNINGSEENKVEGGVNGVHRRQPIRIGVFQEWVSHRPTGTGGGNTILDDAVYKTFQKTIQALTTISATDTNTDDGGGESSTPYATLVNFTMPHMSLQALSHALIVTCSFSFSLLKENFRGLNNRETDDPSDTLQPATEFQLRIGHHITATELLSAMRIRSFAMAQWRNVLAEKVDVILTPTLPMTALVRPNGSDKIGFSDTSLGFQMMRYIWPGNLIGLPGIAVPVGVDSKGLPLSVQVLCLHWHEADCLAVGREIEKMFVDERAKPPPEFFVDLLE